MENGKRTVNFDRIALFLKIGILGAVVILAGDLLMGWGVKDMGKTGLESQLSPYLTVSDSRMLWASVFGFMGVPMAVLGHYGIYQLLKPYSRKYAGFYAAGVLTFLAFGGAGVHVSSVEAAFFYKYMTKVGSGTSIESTVKFASYFLLPLYAILLIGWGIMVCAHLRAVSGGFSPFPRWCFVFSMPIGSLIFAPIGLIGNYAPVNAIMVGAFSLGNIWSLSGHLCMLRRAKENYLNSLSDEFGKREN